MVNDVRSCCAGRLSEQITKGGTRRDQSAATVLFLSTRKTRRNPARMAMLLLPGRHTGSHSTVEGRPQRSVSRRSRHSVRRVPRWDTGRRHALAVIGAARTRPWQNLNFPCFFKSIVQSLMTVARILSYVLCSLADLPYENERSGGLFQVLI